MHYLSKILFVSFLIAAVEPAGAMDSLEAGHRPRIRPQAVRRTRPFEDVSDFTMEDALARHVALSAGRMIAKRVMEIALPYFQGNPRLQNNQVVKLMVSDLVRNGSAVVRAVMGAYSSSLSHPVQPAVATTSPLPPANDSETAAHNEANAASTNSPTSSEKPRQSPTEISDTRLLTTTAAAAAVSEAPLPPIHFVPVNIPPEDHRCPLPTTVSPKAKRSATTVIPETPPKGYDTDDSIPCSIGTRHSIKRALVDDLPASKAAKSDAIPHGSTPSCASPLSDSENGSPILPSQYHQHWEKSTSPTSETSTTCLRPKSPIFDYCEHKNSFKVTCSERRRRSKFLPPVEEYARKR